MKLIILHGPPASGKFTTAKELEAQIGSRTFHNHLTLEVVKPLFEFGSQEFWELVMDLRFTCLEASFRHGTGIIVWTWCYDHPGDLRWFEELEHIAHSENGQLLPVYLECDVRELEKRVSDPDRKRMGKVRLEPNL